MEMACTYPKISARIFIASLLLDLQPKLRGILMFNGRMDTYVVLVYLSNRIYCK
jgi:hypothetical protein